MTGPSAYPRLFAPLQLGGTTLQNRIVMLPHGTSMLADGALSDNDIAYYERRARSRPGLMITGAAVVTRDSTRRGRKLLENYSEHVLPSLARRAEAVTAHGVAIVGQLIHLGRESIGAEGDYPTVAPSAIRSPRDLFPPHELDVDEIRTIVDAFAASARNLERTGHHGAEIHGAHGYLVAQFLSPATNRRTDHYGGDLEGRLRFLFEVIEAIRTVCGPDFLLGLRLSADEELADGIELPESRRIIEAIAKHYPVDYLSVTLGVRGGYVKDVTQPEATAARAAGILRDASGLLTIAGQRMTSPALAERVLEAGQADAIGFARAFIADPDWVAKAAGGEGDRIRPCIGLNQDCRAFAPHLHCAVNPTTGREREPGFGAIRPAERQRKVIVIGGGPAGMEAARIASLRGHAVTLYEGSDGLGGQFLYAAAVPHRGELRRIVDHLQSEIRRLPIDVRLDHPVLRASDLVVEPDVVILATGAEPIPLATGLLEGGVTSWFDILDQGAPPPTGRGRALVVDDGSGFWWTYGVANALVDAGWELTLATPSASIAGAIPAESLAPLLGRLGEGRARYLPLTVMTGVQGGEVELMNATSGEVESQSFDLVVVQTGRRSRTAPFADLRSLAAQSFTIGDCVAPRRVSHALFEAHRTAIAI